MTDKNIRGNIMELISSKDVISIIVKALNLIDKRLIDHGTRVGYIMLKMLQFDQKYSENEILSFVLASVFHDIGAYKSDELDKMVQFETDEVENHSIYGYLFYKYLSPFDDAAKIILYHHIDYNKLKGFQYKYEDVASYINIADRIDVMTFIGKGKMNLNYLRKFANTRFSNKGLDLFQAANNKYHIIDNIKDGSYKEELFSLLEGISLSFESKEKFLKMLIFSIDSRSEYTVMHTITTVSIADEIGQKLNLSEIDRLKLHYGALLHDIGKISTPIEILESDSRLRDGELEIMRNHVAMSEYILKDYINPEIVEIAIRHHEKLDGTGYPKKLNEKDLTLPERILAVADIISALAGKRSYKDIFSKEKIIRILTKDRDDGKLCKTVVNCATKYFDEIMDNVSRNTSTSLKIYGEMNCRYNQIYRMFTE